MKGTYFNYFKGEKKHPRNSTINEECWMYTISVKTKITELWYQTEFFFLILDRIFFFFVVNVALFQMRCFKCRFLFSFPCTQDSRVNNANNSNLNLKSRSNSFSKRTFSISIPSKMPKSKTIQRSKRYTESSPRKQPFHM